MTRQTSRSSIYKQSCIRLYILIGYHTCRGGNLNNVNFGLCVGMNRDFLASAFESESKVSAADTELRKAIVCLRSIIPTPTSTEGLLPTQVS
jgi:hypothetical protein